MRASKFTITTYSSAYLFNFASHFLRAFDYENYANYLIVLSITLLCMATANAYLRDNVIGHCRGRTKIIFILVSLIFVTQIIVSVAQVEISGKGAYHWQDINSYAMMLAGPLTLLLILHHRISFCLLSIIAFYGALFIMKQTVNIEEVIVEERFRAGFELTDRETTSLVLNMATVALIVYVVTQTMQCSKMLKYIATATAVVSLLVGLYFTKRAQSIDALAAFAVVLFYNAILSKSLKNRINNIFLIALALSVIGLAFYYSQYMQILSDRTFYRMADSYSDIGGFDRLNEFIDWYSEIPVENLLMGSGIGSYQEVLGFRNFHLHLGFPNLLFKGGICLILLFIGMIALNLISSIKTRNNKYSGFVFVLTCFTILHMLHSPSWGWYPDSFLIGLNLAASELMIMQSYVQEHKNTYST